MTTEPLTDPEPSPRFGRTKTRVLELLRAADGPLSAQDVAATAGLHANTARFHLDSLVDSGLATRDSENAGRLGRPRMVYRATGGGQAPGRRSYRLLAEMLTSMVVTGMERPGEAAVAAGREWGRYLVERPHPAQRVEIADALHRIRDVMTSAGFVTDPVYEDGGDAVLDIRECPFRELAEQHRDVVCSLHLGLMRGATEEIRAPVTGTSLTPFVSPSLCTARLRPSGGA